MAEIPATRASLLVRLRDPGDDAAWGQFVEIYTPIVYGYARKQGLQDADAADLSQEVLRAVAGAIGRLEYDPSRGAFRNWLFTIARRKLMSWRRGQRRVLVGNGGGELDELTARTEDETAWDAEWEQHIMAWACDQLRRESSETTWQAFWRTAIDGRAGKQVAAELGLTVAAVYHARSRVLARLKLLVQSAQEP